jgi:hypothetical protein
MPRAVKRASLAGSAVALTLYVVLTSGGRFALMHPRYTSNFYDVQARRMFDGHLTVPLQDDACRCFGIEAFVVNGHTHTYFGPLPSFVRMPILLVTSRLDGRLTQLSMAVAFALLLWATARLAWQVRGLLRAGEPIGRRDVAVAALAPFVVGAASVALHLGAVPIVYHEAILWGVATGMVAATLLVSHVASPSGRSAALLGLAVAATLFARASIGFGVVAAVGVVAASVAIRRFLGARPRWTRVAGFAGADALPATTRNLAALAAVIVVPMALYVALNEARFHRPLGPPYAQQVWTDFSADRRAALEANGGSLFNVAYAPSTALAYLRPDGIAPVRLFPFVEFPEDRATVIGDVVFDTRDRTTSATASMPALTALALVGAWAAVSRRHRGALAVLRPLVVGGAVAVVGVLTIGFIAQRYLGDFLPMMIPLALAGVVVAADAIRRVASVPAQRALWAAGALAVAWSVWVNFGLGVLVQRAYLPPYRAGWVEDVDVRHDFLSFQQSLDERLFDDPQYRSGPTVPADSDGTRGELYVVGECEQLLWHDSYVWLEVEPLGDGTTPLCLRLRQ